MSVRRQSLCFVVSLAIVMGALLIPSGAFAQVETMDPDLLTEVLRSDATYSNGNQPQPCDSVCDFVRQAEREPIVNETTRADYMSELRPKEVLARRRGDR